MGGGDQVRDEEAEPQPPVSIYIADTIATYRLAVLPITFDDCVAYETLPFPLARHRDPFDRMLVTQALRVNLDVVGADAGFGAYGATRHW